MFSEVLTVPLLLSGSVWVARFLWHQDRNCFPKGVIWGFTGTVDARKRLLLKPSADMYSLLLHVKVDCHSVTQGRNSRGVLLKTLFGSSGHARYVVGKPVTLADATMDTVGHFSGINHVADATKLDGIKPAPVHSRDGCITVS